MDLSGENKSVEILSIEEDAEGTLWIGTIGTGLISFNPATGKRATYRYERGKPDWISSDVVTRLYIDPQGIVWISTWNGLNRLDTKTGRFRSFRADTSLNKELFSIEPDDRGNLWIGSRVGLVKFSTITETFEEFRHDPNDPTTISNNTVNNIFHDGNGALWLATHNGLNRFDPQTGKSQAYFEKDGLPGNAISCILQDAGGDLWISTNHGVSKMDPKTGRFLNYNSFDGLPGDDMGGWHSCSAGANGRMYFAGFPGAAVTDPSYVEKPDEPMPVVFTDIKIGDRSALYPLKPSSEPYSLAYDDNLAVTFAALDFANPAQARYRYRLSGLDEDWHFVSSTQRTINYAALPAGQFELEVQAATERGDWISKSSPLAVFVATPWWRTWWFYALVLVAFLAVATVAYRLRLRQIAAIYSMRLEERLGERTRVARDLHDTILQSFQGLTYRLEAIRNLLPEQPQKAADMLEVVLRKSDDAIIEGRETIQSLRDPANVTGDLIAAINADARELSAAQTGEVTAKFNLTIEGEAEKFPPNVRHELRQIFREALRNAFTHAHATQIECSFVFNREGRSLP
ncbi:histidine kinase [Aliirhizobium terrae]|uniref:ligand-binding sensor domain-containing protein n=1 Tax=Terrirhizobium terrae TaxID=2926709 RepID=UPI0025785F75|nr:two-component regulator propeller domain-containing protein [Rhizobium sp. CC-CFT758]WJH41502.1 histidine kinase [Rhizobium sp. CC-CFT758]